MFFRRHFVETLSRSLAQHIRITMMRAAAFIREAAARWQVRQSLSVFLLSTGVSLVLLVAGGYTWMRLEQHRLTQSQAHDAASTRTISARDVTLLYIPKIQLEAAILEGTNSKSLLLAPGHLEDTARPGESGNSVIAAHRDTFFRHVHELATGDDIFVRRGGHQYHYVVTHKSIVRPTDTWVASASPESRLTLVTCYPTYYIGPAPKRLVVVAILQPDSGRLRYGREQAGQQNLQ